jgi:MurNAc alpha-1-phosphate uridylyltransferase
MILAAGRGERMRPLTDTRPKPLAVLAGKPLIEFHIERLAAAGVRRIVINLAWLGGQIRRQVGAGDRFGVEVLYSDEGDNVLGTGGGVFNALPMLGDAPFWMVSADLYTEYPYAARPAAASLKPDDLAHLVMVDNPDFHPKGDFGLLGDRVTETGGQRLTYASLAIVHPRLFERSVPGAYSIVPLLQQAMRDGKVGGEYFGGCWHNIGTVAQLQALDEELADNPARSSGRA